MIKPVKKVLFLSLRAFSVTGGIEKFNRAFLKALADLEKEEFVVAQSWSAYDTNGDTNYFEAKSYKCFKAYKIRFVFSVWKAASKFDIVFLGHINLAAVGWGIKKMFPSVKIVLVAHGIEVWEKLNGFRYQILRQADKILAVSNFTKNSIVNIHKIHPDKITVFHNTIDPFFVFPTNFTKPAYLMQRYGLQPEDKILFTLTRLSYTEKYKGYDKVIKIIPLLKQTFSGIKYIISGKYDNREETRINELKDTYKIKDNVLLTGYVSPQEVTDHYLLADVFVLPSRKEGFGIVFIEAMACGLPVIAGNKDGSTDALKNGELGLLIDPEDETEIFIAIKKCLNEKKNKSETDKKALQQKVISLFGFETFKQNLKEVLA